MVKMGKCKKCGNFGLGLKLNSDGICSQCQITDLQAKVNELSCPEYQDLTYIRSQIQSANNTLASLNSEIQNKQTNIFTLQSPIDNLQKDIISLTDISNMQEYGIYEPNFEFLKVDEYKERLAAIRDQQKAMIRDKSAVTGVTTWTVNNSLSQGKKMVSDTQKLLLRAFNGE